MIQVSIKNNEKERSITSLVSKVVITEEEGNLPYALLTINNEFHINEELSLDKYIFGTILIKNKLFFIGKIQCINLLEHSIQLKLVTVYNEKELKPNTEQESINKLDSNLNLINKFRKENPDLCISLNSTEYSKTGVKIISSIVNSTNDIININNIIDNTISIRKRDDSYIDEINLDIIGSWVAKCEGDIDVSNRIATRFKLAKINTLTPKKLIDSWPALGQSTTTKLSRTSKYYIGKSKLVNTDISEMYPIKISENIPDITLNKYTFNAKLVMSWDYDQYISESINIVFINNIDKHRNYILKKNSIKNIKNIRINLKNIQEYLNDGFETSFFSSKNGQLIVNEISKSIINYMILSMRNMEISFEVIDNYQLSNLSCASWISIKGIQYKIVKIERDLNSLSQHMSIKAIGFSCVIPTDTLLKDKEVHINLSKEAFKVKDVIHDIVVQNEAENQYEKLMKYIINMKNLGKLTKDNYKKLITKFLNDNQTRIQIITRPLKKKHCEYKKLIASEAIYLA